MILEKITLVNFRQFKGRNEVQLLPSGEESKNIKLIIGANGAGKTTLLSALHFAFHGENLNSLDNPNRFCHEDVFAGLQDGQDVEVQVEVQFIREGARFALQRSLKIRRFGVQELRLQEDVALLNLDDGRLITPATRWINAWFPPNLARFFFFPGENLKDFFSEEKFADLLEDIKLLSGLDKSEKILEAGNSVVSKLQRRVAGIPGDNEATLLVDAIASLTTKKESLTSQLIEQQEVNDGLAAEYRQINAFLESKRKELGLVSHLAELAAESQRLQKRQSQIEAKIKDFLRTRGWVALTRSAQLTAHSRIQQLSRGGALDAQLSSQLIEELLREAKCICGSDLREGTGARATLEEVKLSLGRFEVPQRYSGLKEAMQTGVLNVNGALAEWLELQKEAAVIRDQIVEGSAEEQRLRVQIASEINDEYLDAQLVRLEDVKTELESIQEKLDSTRARLAETEAALAQKREELSEAKSAQGQHGILIRQMQSLEKVLDSISQDAANVRSNMRLELEAELNQQIRPVYMNEPVTVSIDSNFAMAVTKNGVPFGEANGQKVLRALALVIVLYRISTRLALLLDPEEESRTEATFPLVIDAGFGVLDTSFVKLAVDWLVDLKTQVVLILLSNAAQGVLERILPSEEDISILEMRQKGRGEDEVKLIASKETTLIRFGQSDKETVVQGLSE